MNYTNQQPLLCPVFLLHNNKMNSPYCVQVANLYKECEFYNNDFNDLENQLREYRCPTGDHIELTIHFPLNCNNDEYYDPLIMYKKGRIIPDIENAIVGESHFEFNTTTKAKRTSSSSHTYYNRAFTYYSKLFGFTDLFDYDYLRYLFDNNQNEHDFTF